MSNPFRGLRFSLLDFHSARANTGMKIAMLGIALIPLSYGALYLMAFYDPYGSLDTLPVAVVNEDVPVTTKDGKQVRGWAATVDWFFDHFQDVYEGKYTDTEEAKGQFHNWMSEWVNSGVVCKGE